MNRAFERLLVGRKLDVGGELVRRERRKGDPRLEGAAVEMRIFGDAGESERDPAELGGVGYERLTAREGRLGPGPLCRRRERA